jgi:hypothetical protein
MTGSVVATVANQLGWTGDAVTVRNEGMTVTTWVVVDEDEHHRRAGAGAVGSIQELYRNIGAEPHGSSLPAPPLRIIGVAGGPAAWHTAASAVGRYVTVAPRVVILTAEDADDDLVRAEASMWGVGVIVDGEMVAWPAAPELEHGLYQRWLAEESYEAWLRGSPTQRSVA